MSGTSTRRPLPVGAEVRRQLGRRRTRLILGFLLVLPLLSHANQRSSLDSKTFNPHMHLLRNSK